MRSIEKSSSPSTIVGSGTFRTYLSSIIDNPTMKAIVYTKANNQIVASISTIVSTQVT